MKSLLHYARSFQTTTPHSFSKYQKKVTFEKIHRAHTQSSDSPLRHANSRMTKGYLPFSSPHFPPNPRSYATQQPRKISHTQTSYQLHVSKNWTHSLNSLHLQGWKTSACRINQACRRSLPLQTLLIHRLSSTAKPKKTQEQGECSRKPKEEKEDLRKVKKRINHLSERIATYNNAYYNQGVSLVSDFEFDKLFHELKELETNFPQFAGSTSPTQAVGAAVAEATFKHRTPMLSLENSYDSESVAQFINRAEKQLMSIQSTEKLKLDYVCELKYDGCATSLVYENSRFKYAVSRGDGLKGGDLTQNVRRTVKDLPLAVPPVLIQKDGNRFLLKNFEVRGEAVMSKQTFAKLNDLRKKSELPLFKNARNLVSGIMNIDLGPDKQRDSKQMRDSSKSLIDQTKLEIIAYSLLLNEDSLRPVATGEYAAASCFEIDTHSANLDLLMHLGFRTDSEHKLCASSAQVLAFISKWSKARDLFPWETDGIVVKVNSHVIQSALGSTSRFPKWAIAYKFSPLQVATKFRGISLGVGRTGRITPVAELDPVEVMGSTISRATLHNFDYIFTELPELRSGCFVTIEKGGDVIPKVSGVIQTGASQGEETNQNKDENQNKTKSSPEKQNQTNALSLETEKVNLMGKHFPELLHNGVFTCPCARRSRLVNPEGRVDFFCQDPHCPEQQLERLAYFCSRPGLALTGLAQQTLKELVAAGLLTDVSSFFQLKENREQILQLAGWGQTKLDKILTSIEIAKRLPLHRLLTALSIPLIGANHARLVALHCGTFANFRALNSDSPEPTGLGSVIWHSVIQFVLSNQPLLSTLEEVLRNSPLLHSESKPTDVIYPSHTTSSSNTASCPIIQAPDIFESKESENQGEQSKGVLLNSESQKENISVKFDASLQKLVQGKKLLVTGAVPGLTRDGVLDYLRQIGATPVSSVSRITQLVLLGNEFSQSKKAKADTLGIPCHFLSDFIC